MKYYSAIKNNKILLFATTWMDVEYSGKKNKSDIFCHCGDTNGDNEENSDYKLIYKIRRDLTIIEHLPYVYLHLSLTIIL